MRLSIENVGILSKVDLEINGITVIAGENDTGKSTISKSLYAMFNGFYRIDEKIENMKIKNLRRDIIEVLEREFGVYINTQYLKKDVLSKTLLKKDFIDKKNIREIVEDTIKNTSLKRKPNSSIDEIVEELEKRINNIKQTKDINITNKLGNIEVSNLPSESSDNINLKTTTGNITLSNLTANNSITLKTTEGDIIAELSDEESNFTNSSNKKKQLFTSSNTGTVNVKFSNK